MSKVPYCHVRYCAEQIVATDKRSSPRRYRHLFAVTAAAHYVSTRGCSHATVRLRRSRRHHDALSWSLGIVSVVPGAGLYAQVTHETD